MEQYKTFHRTGNQAQVIPLVNKIIEINNYNMC